MLFSADLNSVNGFVSAMWCTGDLSRMYASSHPVMDGWNLISLIAELNDADWENKYEGQRGHSRVHMSS